jgi:hypothetical protein
MKIEDNMKPRFWTLFYDAVKTGIRGGLYKCQKWDMLTIPENDADLERIVDLIENYVACALDEQFETDEGDKDA